MFSWIRTQMQTQTWIHRHRHMYTAHVYIIVTSVILSLELLLSHALLLQASPMPLGVKYTNSLHYTTNHVTYKYQMVTVKHSNKTIT